MKFNFQAYHHIMQTFIDNPTPEQALKTLKAFADWGEGSEKELREWRTNPHSSLKASDLIREILGE